MITTKKKGAARQQAGTTPNSNGITNKTASINQPSSVAGNSSTSFDQKAFRAERLANEVLAAWCEYGADCCYLSPEKFPTNRHQKIAEIVLEATTSGERGWAEICTKFLHDEQLRQSFITAVQEQPVPTTPIGAKRLTDELRRFHLEKERIDIAQRITAKIDAGEDCGPELEELNKLTEQSEPETLSGLLVEREFKFSVRPEKPEPLIQLNNQPLCTRGNITNIQAPPKAGKSAVVDAILAASLNGIKQGCDTLGFVAQNPNGHALIHFDTEQSRYDADSLVRRCMRRANISDPPAWFYSYSVADLEIETRKSAMHHEVRSKIKEHDGIFAVVIDGIGDLCKDPNDSVEAFNLVHELVTLSIQYDCTIITVLHENPGSESGKTRGHLGSHIERKAETNLRLAKSKDGITTIWADKARHCHLPKELGSCFTWNTEKNMHTSCGTAIEMKRAADFEKMKTDAELSFGDAEGMIPKELTAAIMESLTLKERAAKGRMSRWCKYKIIRKASTGKYYINQ